MAGKDKKPRTKLKEEKYKYEHYTTADAWPAVVTLRDYSWGRPLRMDPVLCDSNRRHNWYKHYTGSHGTAMNTHQIYQGIFFIIWTNIKLQITTSKFTFKTGQNFVFFFFFNGVGVTMPHHKVWVEGSSGRGTNLITGPLAPPPSRTPPSTSLLPLLPNCQPQIFHPHHHIMLNLTPPPHHLPPYPYHHTSWEAAS